MPRRFGQSGSSLIGFVRRHRIPLTVSGLVGLASLILYVPLYLVPHPSPLLQILTDIELKTLDTRFQLRGERAPDPSIVIVAIDQKSQDVLGRWPFPRSYLAEAVDFLRAAGARVIAFDIDFPQPDENSALQALREVKKDYASARKTAAPGFEGRLDALEAEADNDKKFAEALSRFKNAILGYFFLPESEAKNQDRERAKEFLNYLSFQAYPQLTHPEYSKLFEGPEFTALSPDLPQLAVYAKNFGYFNTFPDLDGTVRREPVIARFQGSYYPSLDVAAALAYSNLPLDQVSVFFNPNGLERIDFGRLALPTDPGGNIQIDYHGRAGTYPTYSLADVVKGKVPGEVFRNRLVLVGSTATGIGDTAVTPFQQMGFPGVEVHANLIDNILNGRFIVRGLRENLIDLFFILFFSVGAGLLLSFASPLRASSIILGVFAVFLWLAYYLFAAHRIWIAVFLPSIILGVNYAGIISYRFFFEEREKKRVRAAFQQYLPPSLIEQLLERPELLQLGGEERELTIMFSDIRGFTSLSEGLSPRDLVELLNEYLSEMTGVIFRNWGTLDKYIGDAIMAFWGAPYPHPDHAERACHTALEMLQALGTLRERWQGEGRPLIDVRIGINTGRALVGNMGSSKRFNYTTLGDNVNLASRLEGLNKEFGTRLIISEFTYEKVLGSMLAREMDLIRVKGKKKPVRIFELLGTVDELVRFEDLIRRFQEGLEAYRSARWESAVQTFEALHNDYPRDVPSETFLERCRLLLEQPPEGVWDGVFVMETK